LFETTVVQCHQPKWASIKEEKPWFTLAVPEWYRIRVERPFRHHQMVVSGSGTTVLYWSRNTPFCTLLVPNCLVQKQGENKLKRRKQEVYSLLTQN